MLTVQVEDDPLLIQIGVKLRLKLAHLDRRYRTRYGMSMVENLKTLKEKGMAEFLRLQTEKHTYPVCGDVVSVHDGKCYGCGYM